MPRPGPSTEAVAEEVLDRFEAYHDEDGALLGVVAECAAGLCKCLKASAADAAHRDRLIRARQRV